ncbi:acyloxyacyl hydrolase [Motiliproteus sp. SC1-56]|uniref:acyloxyacyl hydrolase n=1 Tax=Motiliproteus sp. SC1-56 TaxID=2799565 RepID=UPI001A908D1A|nr:acyloxyacyl hydrolase [Motiliproteus sp. SC1-56]
MSNRPGRVLSALLLACLGLASAGPADASGALLHLGQSLDRDANFYRLAFRHPWERRWFTAGNWFLAARFELAFIHVETNHKALPSPGSAEHLEALALTPLLRYQRRPYANGLAPFVELGIGFSYFSEEQLEDDTHSGKNFGGHFQFEDKLAAGVRAGKHLEAAIGFFHYSNADTNPPNEGFDAWSLSLGYRF